MNIRMENLTKCFGQTIAVDALTCSIPDGALVCLLGPSGCGKTTTLHMIAGLESPTKGEIYFDDMPVCGIAPENRDIGMVFQNYALYPHMTIGENIMFPLKMRRVPRRERRERAEQIAQLMQISDLLHRKPGQLSGGQQQRAAIARALVKQPKILLLDEPFSNLDARLRITLREEIRSLQQKLGITTIFVTHDQEEAMRISDWILLLRDGQTQQFATPDDMYHHPANQFAAGFLGNPPINFLPCVCDGQSAEVLSVPGWRIPCTPCSRSGQMTLGVRPEDVVLQDGPDSHLGIITTVQPLGKEVCLTIRLDDCALTACMRWDQRYSVGQQVPVRVTQSHLFTEAGMRYEE